MKGRLGQALCLCVAAILGMTATPAPASIIRVTMSELKFSPQDVQAEVGDTVEWINKDILAHTATAQGRWDVVVPPNGSGRVVLKKAGEVTYYCRFHPNMTARIIVAARDRK
jgi:plastocyanin